MTESSENMSKSRTIVLGGARSGKSAFAEGLVNNSGKPKVYIATAQAFDGEMRTRIVQHQSRRDQGWTTVEAPLEAAGAIDNVPAGNMILFDCATLWLSNQMMANNDVVASCDMLMDSLMKCRADVVVVSNEVGNGIVPDNAVARQFRDSHGALNQRLAAWADLAVLVVAGLPVVLKGTLPDDLK